jgi:hypothetical protein
MPWSSKSSPSGFPTNALYNFLSSPIRATFRPPRSPWFDLPNDILGWAQNMELLMNRTYVVFLLLWIHYSKDSYLCIGHFGDGESTAIRLRYSGAKRNLSCNSNSFFTSALYGGEWLASGFALPPENDPRYPFNRSSGWASELVWIQRLEEKCFNSAEDLTPLIQCVVRHYNDWATRAF